MTESEKPVTPLLITLLTFGTTLLAMVDSGCLGGRGTKNIKEVMMHLWWNTSKLFSSMQGSLYDTAPCFLSTQGHPGGILLCFLAHWTTTEGSWSCFINHRSIQRGIFAAFFFKHGGTGGDGVILLRTWWLIRKSDSHDTILISYWQLECDKPTFVTTLMHIDALEYLFNTMRTFSLENGMKITLTEDISPLMTDLQRAKLNI